MDCGEIARLQWDRGSCSTVEFRIISCGACFVCFSQGSNVSCPALGYTFLLPWPSLQHCVRIQSLGSFFLAIASKCILAHRIFLIINAQKMTFSLQPYSVKTCLGTQSFHEKHVSSWYLHGYLFCATQTMVVMVPYSALRRKKMLRENWNDLFQLCRRWIRNRFCPPGCKHMLCLSLIGLTLSIVSTPGALHRGSWKLKYRMHWRKDLKKNRRCFNYIT